MRKKPNSKQCYRCGKDGVTAEHFPPKVFFPEQREKLALKTVPSCKAHNNDKSKDDEYVFCHICMNIANGDNLAKKRFLDSGIKIIKHSEKFRKMLVEGSENISDAVMYKVDIDRFDNLFDNLTCAVYYDLFDERFNSKTHLMRHVYLNFLSEDEAHIEQVKAAYYLFKPLSRDPYSKSQEINSAKIDEPVYSHVVMAPVRTIGSITIFHKFYGKFEVMSLLTRLVPSNVFSR